MATVTPAATYTIGTPWHGGSNPSPVYSGTFIPILWSKKIIEKFYDASVLTSITNTNYEGEIKNMGDHVVIRQRPDVTINAYEVHQDLSIEHPSVATVELLIDQGNYWNVAIDDVMEVQSDLDMLSMWAQDAAEQMRIVVETEVLDNIYPDLLAAAGTANTAGATAGRISGNIDLGVTTAPVALTQSGTGPTAPGANTQDIMDFILRMAQVLDENNAPETGRFLVLPAWACQMFKASDLRQADKMGDATSVYRTGLIGKVDRFDVYMSNLLPTAASTQTTLTGSEYVIFAGTTHAVTFATQLTKVETLRSERSFSNLMRGLQVYGRKVIDPKYMVGAVVTQ